VRILVTGGVRSGKSRHAEGLLAEAESVTYVAPGPTAADDPDPDWAARLASHKASRPSTWRTVETRDLVSALTTDMPVLVDCLGTWLTGVLDERGLWDEEPEKITDVIARMTAATAGILRSRDDVVLVTNEVGLGVVPEHRSGRLFRDLLGMVNQEIAAACDEVHLVVAGRVLTL
jgi:adenosylcobinamide kinase / adenosylcobinamide-phosphate guanylyltransferase